jgi:hypothetical protein
MSKKVVKMLVKNGDLFSSHFFNIIGWHTQRKIVVFESDDWGSIRMPSKYVYDKLLKLSIPVDKCPYNKYDSIESDEDLSALFQVLTSCKDINGKHPVITANSVVANPDFEKIKESGFQQYFYEPITSTYEKYSRYVSIFETIQQGRNLNIFYPQFHGREHVNVNLWLNLLQQKNELFLKAFEMGLWGIGPEIQFVNKMHIQASFDCLNRDEISHHSEILKEGLKLFSDIFGYRSQSFIANNFIWDASLNNVLANEGVKFIQGMRYQKSPFFDNEFHKLIIHYTGQRNEYNQLFLIRNCNFEPTENPKIDNVSKCLKQIQNSFFWGKPAIISTHRLNYIGSIVKKNRDENLVQFKQLIGCILKNWPNVEFMTTVELGEYINGKKLIK